MRTDSHHVPVRRRSLKLRAFGVITAVELLLGSSYVSPLLGWVLILAACVLMGASAGAFGRPSDAVGGLREHRQ